jgi:hypothetical protein
MWGSTKYEACVEFLHLEGYPQDLISAKFNYQDGYGISDTGPSRVRSDLASLRFLG